MNTYKKNYIFIDPFSKVNSGVTRYIQLSKHRLEALGYNVFTINSLEKENIIDFSTRIAEYIDNFKEEIYLIECPESLAASRLIPKKYNLHIRLHCSRSLGAIVQGNKYNKEDIRLEQIEISRANLISAPSAAAVAMSSLIFKFNKKVNIYPNPSPEYFKLKSQSLFDVLFVGRLQKLKGIVYLETLIKSRPDLKFALATSKDIKSNLHNYKNVTFFDGEKLSKEELFKLSETVIVPSIFETSSMVILESLSFGRKVVSWDHLGTLEFVLDRSTLFTAPLFKTLSLEKALSSAIKSDNQSDKTYINIISSINSEFDYFFKKEKINYEGEDSDSTNNNIPTNLKSLLLKTKKNMDTEKMHPLLRKTRKLIRNPSLFLKDSKYFGKKQKFNDNFAESSNEDKFTINLVESENIDNFESPGYVVPTHLTDDKTNLYSIIPSHGRIEFLPPREKPLGHTIAFFYSEKDVNDKNIIIDKFEQFSDFKYLSKDRLHLGINNIECEEEALSIVNRIDFKNKTNFSKINFVILLNPSDYTCEALRNIGTDQKIIVINTTGVDYLINSINIDFLINIETSSIGTKIPSVIKLENMDNIHIALRKILQDNFPKQIDMLLCINPNENKFTREEFERFDYNNFHGIIKIKNDNYIKAQTMNTLLWELSKNIEGMALVESIYSRYKDFCVQAEESGDYFNLLQRCLRDGVLLDVKA